MRRISGSRASWPGSSNDVTQHPTRTPSLHLQSSIRLVSTRVLRIPTSTPLLTGGRSTSQWISSRFLTRPQSQTAAGSSAGLRNELRIKPVSSRNSVPTGRPNPSEEEPIWRGAICRGVRQTIKLGRVGHGNSSTSHATMGWPRRLWTQSNSKVAIPESARDQVGIRRTYGHENPRAKQEPPGR